MTCTSTRKSAYSNKTTLTSLGYAWEGGQYKWSSQKSIELPSGPDQGTSVKYANFWASQDTIATSSRDTRKSPDPSSTSPNKRRLGAGRTKSKTHSRNCGTRWSVNRSYNSPTLTKPSISKPTHPSTE